MRLLLQRLQLHKAPCDLDAGGGVGPLPGQSRRAVQHPQHHGPARGALGHLPLVKQRRAQHLHARQEVPTAQAGRGQQRLRVICRGQPRQLQRVDPDRLVGQRHRLAAHLQVVGQRPAQLDKHQPQIGPRGLLGQVAPQQPGQRRPRVGGAGHRQVGQ
jgi:hypothetical protein